MMRTCRGLFLVVRDLLFVFVLGVVPLLVVGCSSTGAQVSLTLCVNENVPNWRESAKLFKVYITNEDSKELMLAYPVDGSYGGYRSPFIGWSAIPLKDNVEAIHPENCPRFSESRCGVYNSRQEDDFFSLSPGESFEFKSMVYGPVFPGPGRYSVVFYYENRPMEKFRAYLSGGNMAEEMEMRLRETDRCTAKSNAVVLDVLDVDE